MKAGWEVRYENLKLSLKAAQKTIEYLLPELERVRGVEALGVKGNEDAHAQLKQNVADAKERVATLQKALDEFFD